MEVFVVPKMWKLIWCKMWCREENPEYHNDITSSSLGRCLFFSPNFAQFNSTQAHILLWITSMDWIVALMYQEWMKTNIQQSLFYNCIKQADEVWGCFFFVSHFVWKSISAVLVLKNCHCDDMLIYSHSNMKLAKQVYFGTFCDVKILFAWTVKPSKLWNVPKSHPDP